MPSIHYSVNISLKKADWELLKKLQASGIKCVDILRAGLAEKEKQVKKGEEK